MATSRGRFVAASVAALLVGGARAGALGNAPAAAVSRTLFAGSRDARVAYPEPILSR